MEIRNGIIFFDTKAEFEAYVSDTNNVSITNYPVYIGDTKEIITHNVTYKDASEIDASQITSGKISIDRLPAGSLERCVVVANESARFALTTNDVQDGDTVKQSDTGVMYMVVDVNNLNSDAGYLTYTAVTDWESIANKPEFDYVKYSEQELTDEQKQIARENIGVPTKVSELENDKNYLESGSGDGTNLLADDGEYKAIKTLNGESLLGEGNIDVEHLIEVTYNELYDLKHSSQLIPGAKYRIMDYECMLKSESVKGVIGSYYTVVVTALTNNQLSHDGVAVPNVPQIYAYASNDYYSLNFSNEYIVIKAGNYEYFCKRHFKQDSDLISTMSPSGECVWASVTEKTIFTTSTKNGTVGEIVTDQNGKTYTVTVPAKTYYGWSRSSISRSDTNLIAGLSLNKNITNGDTIFQVRSSDFRIEYVATVTFTETPSVNWHIDDYTYRIKYLFENAELREKLNYGAAYCPNLETIPFSRHALVHCQLDDGSEGSIYFEYVPSMFNGTPWWCAVDFDSGEMLVLANENELTPSYNIKTGEQYLLCGLDGSYLMPIGTATIIEDSQLTFQLHKGFIYEMEDVHGNQFPYDFKNSVAYKREGGDISPNGFLHSGCSNNKVILDTLRYEPVVVSFANGSDDNRVELGDESHHVIRIEYSKCNFIKSSMGDILLDSSSYNVITDSYDIKLNGGSHNVIKDSYQIEVDAADHCEFHYNWSIDATNPWRFTNCFFGHGANNITFNSGYVSDVSIISGISNVVFDAERSENIKVEVSNVTLGEDVSNNKIVGKNSANQTIIYNPADSSSDTILNSTF